MATVTTAAARRSPPVRTIIQGTATTVPLEPRLTACPLCTSPRLTPFDRTWQGFHVERCRGCGIKFMNPQCTDAYLAEQYCSYLRVEDDFDSQRASRRRRDKQDILTWIGRAQPPGRLLSLGCGDGVELDVVRRLGWQPVGYDIHPEDARRVAERLDVPVYSGDLTALPVAAEAFDCVFLDQLLEHLKQPQDYLRTAHRLLRPGGVLYIGCPNMESVSHTWKTWQGKLGLRRRRGRHYDMCKHLFYYSPGKLSAVLERQFGFRVLAAEGAPLAGLKAASAPGLINRLISNLKRTWPVLDSSFRLLARRV